MYGKKCCCISGRSRDLTKEEKEQLKKYAEERARAVKEKIEEKK